MKCLTIKQPWAWLITEGYKGVENRSWKTLHRGEFLIHSAQTVDAEAMKQLPRLFPDIEFPASYDLGKVIGKVELYDCITDSDSQWAQPRSYHFMLRNAQTCRPVQYKGQLNFFNVDEKYLIVNFKNVFEEQTMNK